MIDGLATRLERPLSEPSIAAICEAAAVVHAFRVVVHWRNRVHEVGIWQAGEWVGSVFRWPDGGLGAWSSLGDWQGSVASVEAAVQRALEGRYFAGSRAGI